MKKLCILLAIAALWFGYRAEAQVPTYASQTLGLYTNFCATGAAMLMTNITIDCKKQATVTLQLSFSGDQSGTGTLTTYYKRSVDGSTYETTLSPISVALPNGNAQVCICTNLQTYGCGYIQLAYATNNSSASANVTNYTAKYGVKISAP